MIHTDTNRHLIKQRDIIHQRYNLIFFINKDWKEEYGGHLELWNKDATVCEARIAPAFNRCVIFETNENSWHGFQRINLPEDQRHLSRKSFALYYYTDCRPAEEVGAEHSTIYVEEHLPEHFEVGMKLGVVELQKIRSLLTSRDQHLKRLYADIKHLNTDLNYLHGEVDLGGSIDSIMPDKNDSVEQVILKKRLVYLHQRVRELESSSSWRITRPLRVLKRALTGKG